MYTVSQQKDVITFSIVNMNWYSKHKTDASLHYFWHINTRKPVTIWKKIMQLTKKCRAVL